MKYSLEKLLIHGKKERYRLERFVEEICDFHNITNEYFGNIQLATSEAAEVLFSLGSNTVSDCLNVSFEKSFKGLIFKINLVGNCNDFIVDEDLLDREIRRHQLGREIYIIKSLTDEFEINANGTGIHLIFYVSSINFEKSLQRIQFLKSFWEKEKNVMHEN
ncbi:MAG: hypothetical protein NT004_04645 [Bacteroidetes bacterium]|nr:hypothetical protein [Bacteroidota bacterium]